MAALQVEVAEIGAAVARVEAAVIPPKLSLAPEMVTTWQQLEELDKASPGKSVRADVSNGVIGDSPRSGRALRSTSRQPPITLNSSDK